ncbi:MAG TPA: phospho-N-acetylmuramoyl-pentapeptide-transferase [Candidatus Acidoferrum sp.]|nr:phospho-N-acetylmuramoyl-pentapeptide-transferase [Candidatus Acidoferrum sp.]
MNLLATGVLALAVPYLLASSAGGRLIAALRRASAQQTAYEDAPKTHQAKTGTPTMGGLLFIAAPIVALLLAPSRSTLALTVLVLGCMAIGAVDDLAAIRKQKNRGLRALPKFALTGLAAAVFLLIAGEPVPPGTTFLGIGAAPAWLWYGLSLCVILATTHAVNLTDGLDGLAAGTIVPPLVVLTVIAFRIGTGAVGVFELATLGAVVAFFQYNRHPARVFMGDTGSLALGAALAGGAILTGTQLLLPLIGGVFAAETLSVIVQVASYKTTRRRVFRMSPLHHHFELGGWPETKVTMRFWIASFVLSLLGFALITRTA